MSQDINQSQENAHFSQSTSSDKKHPDHLNPDDPSPSAEFTQKYHEMLQSDPLPSREDFTTLLAEYIQFIQKSVHVDKPPQTATYKQDSPDNPKFIQSLYRGNRPRAIRKIIKENTTPCQLNPQELSAHFYEKSPLPFDLSYYDDWAPAESPVDLSCITPAEVWQHISRAENTAPGLDRITYHHLRSIDPDALTLAEIFNLYIKYERVPDSWKLSRTVFIPKHDDGVKCSDWRPISLCTTISKLFTGCLSKRLTDWAVGNKVLCAAQKGFMPYDGAFENCYVFDQFQNHVRKSEDRE